MKYTEIRALFEDKCDKCYSNMTDDDRYVGLGSVLISPMRDIAEIDIKWRRQL